MSRVAIASINLRSLKHNLSVAKKAAPGSKVLAVIKANAYGHGLLEVAESLVEADAFAVAHFEEAIALRKKFPEKRIVLLQGYADEIELTFILSQFVQPVIHAPFQIDMLENFAAKNPFEKFSVWLKVDTGMHRLGVSIDEFNECWTRLNAIQGLQGNVNVMSHFANADVIHHSSNEQQSQLFEKITTSLNCEKSLVNSAGLLSRNQNHYQWVRPGIMLYGVCPFEDETATEYNLRPVMSFSSRIIAINKVMKGQAIGYGSCWEAPDDINVAVIGVGYGDGYPRHIGENTPVLINGERFPVVGRVSMDMICVNIGEKISHQVGDEVLLWGDGLPVEEIAEKASTIAYELLCQVTARVKFIYHDSEQV
ncbi:MAG: alanine racemase [Gammaproteobacteria bacterium]|nr:alanine racemase [Gammaproteobacteria bacterium]